MSRNRSGRLRWFGMVCLLAAMLLASIVLNINAYLDTVQFTALILVVIVLTGSAILFCTQQ